MYLNRYIISTLHLQRTKYKSAQTFTGVKYPSFLHEYLLLRRPRRCMASEPTNACKILPLSHTARRLMPVKYSLCPVMQDVF